MAVAAGGGGECDPWPLTIDAGGVRHASSMAVGESDFVLQPGPHPPLTASRARQSAGVNVAAVPATASLWLTRIPIGRGEQSPAASRAAQTERRAAQAVEWVRSC